MDLSGLALGLETALQPDNILICLLGVTLGTLVGVLPGIGPTATVALLLPITFNFDPIASLIMLSGIYYGAQYGGSTTAILLNLPGESSSAVTALDGHQMARQGRAGPALAAAALGCSSRARSPPWCWPCSPHPSRGRRCSSGRPSTAPSSCWA